MATALIFGALPGWRAAREADWKEAGRGSAAVRSARWVKGAMALQLAASLVLILGAGLFVRSLQNLVTADYGYNRAGLATVSLSVSDAGYTAGKGHLQRNLALLAQVRTLPQAQAAVLATQPRPGSGYFNALRVPGYVPAPGETTTVFLNRVTPGYFALMGIPILAGRDFDDHDRQGRVAIVSESLARHFFRRVDATGEIIAYGAGQRRREVRIVGVAGDTPVRDTTYDLLYEPEPDEWWANVIARPKPGVTVPALMAALRTLAKRPEIKQDLNVVDYAAIFDSTVQQDRMLAVLAAVFGGLGAGLALVGLYGAMAYAVSRRTAEMGVRMALGARPAQIARMVIRETAALGAIGLLLGVPLGALASRLVAARLFLVRPFDPLAIAAVAFVMTAVSLVAALLPAWRAARVDPSEALRAE
jgi:predicted permease